MGRGEERGGMPRRVSHKTVANPLSKSGTDESGEGRKEGGRERKSTNKIPSQPQTAQ